MIKQQIAFALQYGGRGGFGDHVIITFKPLVFVLTNKASVMTRIECSEVIDHGVERVSVMR